MVNQLLALNKAYPNNTYFYTEGGAYNSNSFTYTLLTDAGVPIPSTVNAYLLQNILPFPSYPLFPYVPRAPGRGP